IYIHHPLSTSLTYLFVSLHPTHPKITLFTYTTLFRSEKNAYEKEYNELTDQEIINLHIIEVPLDNCNFRTVKNKENSTIKDKDRSEEHTSELQSRFDLVCRLLLEKKNYIYHIILLFSK